VSADVRTIALWRNCRFCAAEHKKMNNIFVKCSILQHTIHFSALGKGSEVGGLCLYVWSQPLLYLDPLSSWKDIRIIS
jgi:hypothetical protein